MSKINLKNKVRCKFFAEAFLIFNSRIMGVGFTFLFTAIITKTLGASQAGVFFLCQTIILIASLVSRLGFDNLIVKKLAPFSIDKSQNIDKVWGVVGSITILVLTSSFFAVLFLNVLAPFLNNLFSIPNFQNTINIVSLSIPLIVLLYIFSEVLKGSGLTVLATLTQSLLLPLSFTLVLYFSFKNLSLHDALWGYVLAVAISLAITSLIIFVKIGKPSFKSITFDIRTFGDLIKESLPLLWAGAAGLIFSWTDTLVLGVVQSSEEVGLYVVASRSSQVIALILMVANTLLGIRFARLYSANRIEDLKILFFKSSGVMFLLSLVSIIPFIFFPLKILSLFGSEFTKAVIPMYILVFGQFINVATGAGGILLVMLGKSKSLQYIMLFVMLFNLFFSYVLGAIYSGSGVATATALSMIIMNILILFNVLGFVKEMKFQ